MTWDPDLGYDKYKWTCQDGVHWVNKKYPKARQPEDCGGLRPADTKEDCDVLRLTAYLAGGS